MIKTGTFAIIHFLVAFTIAYLLTGSLGIASAIALIEPFAKTFAYFLHEQFWARRDRAPRAVTTEGAE
ncbi:MAG: DUF2061 domain-containing protein, partial [Proteobacteria bacterium]|nr:DUF2061 domain-containing protein [Burkholderiales bacterium]